MSVLKINFFCVLTFCHCRGWDGLVYTYVGWNCSWLFCRFDYNDRMFLKSSFTMTTSISNSSLNFIIDFTTDTISSTIAFVVIFCYSFLLCEVGYIHIMTTIGFYTKLFHNLLPFNPMRLDFPYKFISFPNSFITVKVVLNYVSNFMGDSIVKKVLSVPDEKFLIEPNCVSLVISDSSITSSKVKLHCWNGKI